MTKNRKPLLKKELYELFFNVKSWLNVLVWAMIPYLPQIKSSYAKFIVALLFSMFAGGQYIYDSYLSDSKYGGGIFLYNTDITFLFVFVIKLITSLFLSCIALCINIPHILLYIQFSDGVWFLALCIAFSTIMFISSVFSKGAEMTTAIISILFGIMLFAFVFILKDYFYKVMITIAINFILLYISYSVSKSIMYRSQL